MSYHSIQLQGRFALTNGQIVLPQEIVVGKAMIIDDGRIAGIDQVATLGGEMAQFDVGGRLITPGLIDLHIHGALGHTFNEPTAEAFATITEENVKRGVTAL